MAAAAAMSVISQPGVPAVTMVWTGAVLRSRPSWGPGA